MDQARSSISQLLGDVRSRAAALAGAQFDLLSLEMQQKLSGWKQAGAWIGIAVLMLVAAFGLGVTALLLAVVRMGISADIAAAGLAVLLAICGLLMLRHGAAMAGTIQFSPSRTFAQMRASFGLAPGNDDHG